MTRTPKLARRLAVALAAALGLLIGHAPASSQTTRPCPESASRDSCANLPLDDYRRRPSVPPPQPDPETRNPLRPAAWRAVPVVGRVGQRYGPLQLITGGTPPYEPETNGLPDSLGVDERGRLYGRPGPRDVGVHPFTLTIRDSAGAVITQDYRLRIVGRAPSPRPVVKPPAPVVKPQQAAPLLPAPQVDDGDMAVYVLRKADMSPPKVAPPPPPPPPPPEPPQGVGGAGVSPPRKSSEPPVPPPPPPPPAEPTAAASYPVDLAVHAASLRNVEYTTRELFEQALRNRYDPRRPTRAKVLPTPLSEAQIDLVADRAREIRSFEAAPTKLNWAPEAGCGCALPLALQTKEVYGFFPFWRSKQPPPSIIFSKVSRIGFMGVQLSSNGTWIQPSGPRDSEAEWWLQTSRIARDAHAHGARLDLVLQRSDWTFLAGLSDSQRRLLAGTAARSAVELADTRLRNRGLSTLLLPFWKEPRYVFDGVTVMFDYPEGAPDSVRSAYLVFHDVFIDELIRAMQKPQGRQRRAREYTLHIVAPDPLAAGATTSASEKTSMWREFLNYKQVAEPPWFHRAAPPKERRAFQGSSNIRVRLIAPVREPTSDSKKRLRANIDQLTDVRGYNRVAVLQSILPLAFLPAGDGPFPEPAPPLKLKATPNVPVKLTAEEWSQLDDDIIYYRQNFGGVAFWPAPMQNDGAARYVYDSLKRVFYERDSGPLAVVNLQPVCSLVLRLLWQALAVVGVVALVAWFAWGQASPRAPLFRRGLIGLGIAFVVLSGVLLTIDPALAEISHSNVPLFALVAVALGIAAWRAVKPKIPRP